MNTTHKHSATAPSNTSHVASNRRFTKIVRMSAFLFLPTSIAVAACGTAAGTQPGDMSVTAHQAAANQEEAKAAQEQDLASSPTTCDAGEGSICWSDEDSPTAEHLKKAEEHRKLAAEHRAASQALVQAEARACAGVSNDNRDMSPFTHLADIVRVTRLKAPRGGESGDVVPTTREVGATIVLRAVPGLTVEWLQRIVDCHLARNAALGHQVPEMETCPLVPAHAEAHVRSVSGGFAVDVRSDDPDAAKEIWRRAQLLKPAR